MLRRSASNAEDGNFLRQTTHSTFAFSSERFAQQALHFAFFVRLPLLLHVLSRAGSNAEEGSLCRQLTHSNCEGRPPSPPCSLPRLPAAAPALVYSTLHFSNLVWECRGWAVWIGKGCCCQCYSTLIYYIVFCCILFYSIVLYSIVKVGSRGGVLSPPPISYIPLYTIII